MNLQDDNTSLQPSISSSEGPAGPSVCPSINLYTKVHPLLNDINDRKYTYMSGCVRPSVRCSARFTPFVKSWKWRVLRVKFSDLR